jgi:peptidoglycan/xylan/chitin deacetylase (PgdA/CDA1 family)
MTKFTLFFSLLTCICLWGQDVPVPAAPLAPPVEDPAVPDDGIRVSVLGYHEFSEDKPETAMRISTSKFRKQMETIRQLGITVISMEEFIAWKNGGAKIPEKSILLTLDDGWKSVYTDAFPILKEFNYPFTVYLYKNYVDGGGRALTIPMIKEMIAAGVTIGSHSVSHPYPIAFKKERKRGEDAYDLFLRKEMGESKRFLESKFKIKAPTYSYPGGYFTTEMLAIGKEFGYTHCFTVQPGKVKISTPPELLSRYMILGNYDKIFEFATTFRNSANPIAPPSGAIAGMIQTTAHPVSPEPGMIINSRLPEISADLSKVDDIDPETLVMKVSGFGIVPATFASETGKFSWQVNRRLRHPTCQVAVTWKNSDGDEPETPLRWTFQIDRESAYLPDGE